MAQTDTNYNELKRALQRLEERYSEYLANKDEVAEFMAESLADSCVKHFDYCFEVAWKHLKKYLRERMKVAEPPNSPNKIFEIAAAKGVIENVMLWRDFNEKRGMSSHDYSGEKPQLVFQIIPVFIKAARELYETMTGKG